MLHRLLALPLLAAALCSALVAQEPGVPPLAPEMLYWPGSDGQASGSTGLIYRPELLSALIAGLPAEKVPSRILHAVREQTPVVVMWAIPSHPDEQAVGPPGVHIVDTSSGNTVAPIWEAHDAADLRLIDSRTAYERVGVVAAFPAPALAPGRVVVIRAPLPDNPVTGTHRRSQVYGALRGTGGRSQ